jgi:hypothetical protein
MKFLEHWGFFSLVIIAFLAIQLFMFFENLSGARWIHFFMVSFSLMLLGTALIALAKFPVYRSGRFFTFGSKSVPGHLVKYYKWGWRLFLCGMILSLCLLLSNK